MMQSSRIGQLLVALGVVGKSQLVMGQKAMLPRRVTKGPDDLPPVVDSGRLSGERNESSSLIHFVPTDIDWVRGRIHVQRTYSEKGGRIEPCKNGEDRWVKASPTLISVLRDHLAAMELEGQVKDWTREQRQLVFPDDGGANHPVQPLP